MVSGEMLPTRPSTIGLCTPNLYDRDLPIRMSCLVSKVIDFPTQRSSLLPVVLLQVSKRKTSLLLNNLDGENCSSERQVDGTTPPRREQAQTVEAILRAVKS